MLNSPLNMDMSSEFSHKKWWCSIVLMFVYQRVTKMSQKLLNLLPQHRSEHLLSPPKNIDARFPWFFSKLPRFSQKNSRALTRRATVSWFRSVTVVWRARKRSRKNPWKSWEIRGEFLGKSAVNRGTLGKSVDLSKSKIGHGSRGTIRMKIWNISLASRNWC